MELGAGRISGKVFMQRGVGIVNELSNMNSEDRLQGKDAKLASSAP